jgi:CheY-like chemotaxis protein
MASMKKTSWSGTDDEELDELIQGLLRQEVAIYVDEPAEKNVEQLSAILGQLKESLGLPEISAVVKPADFKNQRSRRVEKAVLTIVDNARFLDHIADMTLEALTVGPRTLMKAEKIVSLGFEANKAEGIESGLDQPPSPEATISFLQGHKDWTFVLDTAAGSRLTVPDGDAAMATGLDMTRRVFLLGGMLVSGAHAQFNMSRLREQAVRLIVKQLGDGNSNPGARKTAAEASTRFPNNPEIAKALVQSLQKDKEGSVRLSVVKSLKAQARQAGVLDALKSASTKDPDKVVRQEALRLLGELTPKAQTKPKDRAMAGESDLRDKKVLMVDNNPNYLKNMSSRLAGLGMQVDTVEGGQEALDKLAGTRYDLVITDYDMPKMTGIELYRRIRDVYPDQKVMLNTDLQDELRAAIAFQNPGLPVVFKGISSEEYAGRLTELLADKAMVPGGIDLNAKKLEMDVDMEGAGVSMTIDPALIEQFRSGDFTGVVPVIIRITPIASPAAILGMADDEIPAVAVTS